MRCGGYKRHSEGVGIVVFALLKVDAFVYVRMRLYANVCDWDDMI